MLDWLDTVDADKDIFTFAVMSSATETLQERFEPLTRVAYAPLLKLCEAFERPPGEMIVIVSSLLTILVCLPLPWIRNTTVRRTYSFAFGLAIGFYTYGVPYFLRIVFIMIGYAQLKWLPRQTSAKWVTITAIVLLSIRGVY